jgi:hypothetical protein
MSLVTIQPGGLAASACAPGSTDSAIRGAYSAAPASVAEITSSSCAATAVAAN